MTMPGIICEMRIASSATLIQRNRNCDERIRARRGDARLSTTVPSEMIRLVTRFPPWSVSARR